MLEVLPGYEWVLRSSKVRIGVNPKGILEGVASRPTGRAWLQRQAAVRAGNASGIPGSGKRAGRFAEEFSQPGAFQADFALVLLLLHREMGVEKGPHPSRLPFSWRTGQEVEGGLRKDVGSVPSAPP